MRQSCSENDELRMHDGLKGGGAVEKHTPVGALHSKLQLLGFYVRESALAFEPQADERSAWHTRVAQLCKSC